MSKADNIDNNIEETVMVCHLYLAFVEQVKGYEELQKQIPKIVRKYDKHLPNLLLRDQLYFGACFDDLVGKGEVVQATDFLSGSFTAKEASKKLKVAYPNAYRILKSETELISTVKNGKLPRGFRSGPQTKSSWITTNKARAPVELFKELKEMQELRPKAIEIAVKVAIEDGTLARLIEASLRFYYAATLALGAERLVKYLIGMTPLKGDEVDIAKIRQELLTSTRVTISQIQNIVEGNGRITVKDLVDKAVSKFQADPFYGLTHLLREASI